MTLGQRGTVEKLRTCAACCLLLPVGIVMAQVADPAAQELQRQQERERALREREEVRPDVRLDRIADEVAGRLPADETPCFPIHRIQLDGEGADRFAWALTAADPAADPAAGRCLGTSGVNTVMARVQDAIIARGYITTRVLAAPQDLNAGTLTLTVVPGRIRDVGLVAEAGARTTLWNALPSGRNDLLNLRDIEQGLENLQRIPTVAADIQIVPAAGEAAGPGESDLAVSWQQRARLRASLTLDDSGSEATGRMLAAATLSLDNPMGWNDLFYVNVGDSVFNGPRRGTSSWTAHYDVPLGYWLLGATASSYDYRQSVAGDSQTYVYSGNSANAEVRAARVLFRNASIRFGAYGRGWWRESDNFIDDTEILVQRRRMAGWEAGFNHRQFVGGATVNASAAYRRGTGAFNALPAPEEAFGEGTSRMRLVTASLQLDVPFHLGGQRLRYSGNWRGQWHRTPLVPQDRLAIGGRYSVRGFDGEISLAGERGWVLRNDVGLALGGGQEFYVGADYGHVAGPSVQWQLGNHLSGAVIGLRGGGGRLWWDLFVGAPIGKPSGLPAAKTTTGFSLGVSF